MAKKNQMSRRAYPQVTPKTENHQLFLKSMDEADITVCIGPAGTGKTHLSVGNAVKHLTEQRVENIILCRPAVEVGRSIGYLPGSQEEKLAPYLRPLFDELKCFMAHEDVTLYQAHRIIEIAPIELMRGRTLKHSFVILDEAQNCSREQLKMFVTRIGEGSKFVINGDHTQSDLPERDRENLSRFAEHLGFIEAIKVVRMGRHDIVRHPIIEQLLSKLVDF